MDAKKFEVSPGRVIVKSPGKDDMAFDLGAGETLTVDQSSVLNADHVVYVPRDLGGHQSTIGPVLLEARVETVITAVSTTPKAKLPSPYLIDRWMPPAEAKDFKANLDEFYPEWVATYGTESANKLWKNNVRMAVLRYWGDQILILIERVAKICKLWAA